MNTQPVQTKETSQEGLRVVSINEGEVIASSANQNQVVKSSKSVSTIIRNILVGFGFEFKGKTVNLLKPVAFLYQHLVVISLAFLHLLAPMAMSWGAMTKISSVQAALAIESQGMYYAYAVGFYAASAFLWISACLFAKYVSKTVQHSMEELEQLGSKK